MNINKMLGRYGTIFRKVHSLAINIAIALFEALHAPQLGAIYTKFQNSIAYSVT